MHEISVTMNVSADTLQNNNIKSAFESKCVQTGAGVDSSAKRTESMGLYYWTLSSVPGSLP